MAYQDCYQSCLNKIPLLSRARVPVRGYTSDVDVIIQWDTEIFNTLLERFHVTESDLHRTGIRTGSIETLTDFLCVVVGYALDGRGGEIDITSHQAVDGILENFKTEFALGGTCVQGAAALGAIGINALIHMTDQSRQVAEFLDYGVIDVIRNGERVSVMSPTNENFEPLFHFVVQYMKGDVLKINGREYKLTSSNRVIMDYDTVNPLVPIDPKFLRYIEGHAREFSSYCISGFNAIIDGYVLKERLSTLKEHYSVIRESNPTLPIYFESAHYLSVVARNSAFLELAPWVDILGMNEEELADFTRGWDAGLTSDFSLNLPEGQGDSLVQILRTMSLCLDTCNIPALVVHSKDYAIFYGKNPSGMTKANIEEGLTFGNLLAGARARVGRYASLEDCAGMLEVPLSPRGLRMLEELSNSSDFERDGRSIVIVPARALDRPVCTIGLGDCFTAGFQLCFM